MNSPVRCLPLAAEISHSDFRDAMRQLAGGVAIVTAGRDQNISGMTVTSLSSLSAEPPRLMVAINRSTSSFPLIESCGFFGVSILGDGDKQVAERFSNASIKGPARFRGAAWTTLQSGSPLFVGALAAIDCQVEEIILRHSHAIIIGRPLATIATTGGLALAYWQADYAPLACERKQSLRQTPTPNALW